MGAIGANRPRTRWDLSEWEYREAVRRIEAAYLLPHGQKRATLERIAPDYGVCVRTLERWRRYKVKEVSVGEYRALFCIGSGQPSQMTRWERAA